MPLAEIPGIGIVGGVADWLYRAFFAQAFAFIGFMPLQQVSQSFQSPQFKEETLRMIKPQPADRFGQAIDPCGIGVARTTRSSCYKSDRIAMLSAPKSLLQISFHVLYFFACLLDLKFISKRLHHRFEYGNKTI